MAGEMHYFRILPDQWEDRLGKLKSANLNCVTTAIEWGRHEPLPGLYDFENELDIKRFLTIANERELLVILKIGPQISAHTDFGGLPYWLLKVNPKMRCRVHDDSFLFFFGRWLRRLYGQIQPFLVGNGGPIIMIQIEDAYGSFPVHDSNYLYWLRDVNRCYVGNKALLFTSDFPDQVCVQRGFIHGVFATLKFGCSFSPVREHFEALKTLQPQGPLMNSQFWIGRPTSWQDNEFNKLDFEAFREELADLIAEKIGFNLHMFVGGTNFGLTGGMIAESAQCTTSYDCDAAISEAGDLTVKYALIQKFISEIDSEYAALDEDGKYDVLSRLIENVETQEIEGKGAYGNVKMSPVDTVLNTQMTCCLKSCISPFLKTMEEMCVKEGLIAYTTTINEEVNENSVITATVRDRAYVILDMTEMIGIMDDQNARTALTIPKPLPEGTKLSFLVETMGRLPYKPGRNVAKGLFNVRLNDLYLDKWTITTYSVKGQRSIKKLQKTIKSKLRQTKTKKAEGNVQDQQTSVPVKPPAFYFGTFTLPKETSGPPEKSDDTEDDKVPENEPKYSDGSEGQEGNEGTEEKDGGSKEKQGDDGGKKDEANKDEGIKDKSGTDGGGEEKVGKEGENEEAKSGQAQQGVTEMEKSKERHTAETPSDDLDVESDITYINLGDRLGDTFMNLTGWKKGVVYINDWCIGRYWTVGPVLTLYVPGSCLLPNPWKNKIIILELEKAPENPRVEFVKSHVMIDKTKVDDTDKINDKPIENVHENEGSKGGVEGKKEESKGDAGEKKEESKGDAGGKNEESKGDTGEKKEGSKVEQGGENEKSKPPTTEDQQEESKKEPVDGLKQESVSQFETPEEGST